MDEIIAWTNDDVELLARLISAEARGECFDGQLAVATVVANRVADKAFPDCLPDVIYQKNQFAAPRKVATESCLRAARMVLLEGYRSFPAGVTMFKTAKQDEWYGRRWWCKIGAHNFYGR